MKCLYSVLRFEPDAARAESVNIGILVGSEETGRWRIGIVRNRRRAQAIAPTELTRLFWRYLEDFRGGLKRDVEFQFSSTWLTEQWAEGGNLLRFSKPAPIAAKDLAVALKTLSGELLIDPPLKRPKPRGQTRASAQAALRGAFLQLGLEYGSQYVENPLVRGENHRATFDFAVRNGSVVQLAQTFNFGRQDLWSELEGVKAWAYTVEDIRKTGGTATYDRKRVFVPATVDVEALYVAPSTRDGERTLVEAQHAFADVGAVAVPLEEADTVGERAASLLEG